MPCQYYTFGDIYERPPSLISYPFNCTVGDAMSILHIWEYL